jgi:hypothetical protein
MESAAGAAHEVERAGDAPEGGVGRGARPAADGVRRGRVGIVLRDREEGRVGRGGVVGVHVSRGVRGCLLLTTPKKSGC